MTLTCTHILRVINVKNDRQTYAIFFVPFKQFQRLETPFLNCEIVRATEKLRTLVGHSLRL